MRRDWLAPAALGILTLVFVAAFAPYLDGHRHNIGGDYSLFLTRMFSDYEWFGVNGIFAAPWFTPAFCGGIPEWGNPQSMPYSLPQWLLFFFDPVWTLQITLALYAIAGASGMWLLLRRGFLMSQSAALLGSTLFLFNGFFICRIIVGHVNFCVLMLFPWVSYFLARPAERWHARALNLLVPGGLIALMIHSGAIAIMPPLGPAWLAVGALQIAVRSERPHRFVAQFAGAIVVALLLSLNKLVAMTAFTAQFPRDFYVLPGFRSVGGWLIAVTHALFGRAHPDVPEDIANILVVPGVQENDYSMSPVPLVLIAGAALWKWRELGAFLRRHWAASVCVTLLLSIPFALNMHGDQWSLLLKKIPVIRSSSSMFRWLVLYVPVLAILAALALEVLPRKRVLAGVGVVAVVLFAVTARRDVYNGFPYAARPLIAAWRDIHETGHVRPIRRMHAPLGPDGMPLHEFGAETAIVIGDNLVRCFEPLFGYQQEALPWRPLHDGPALEAVNGLLNVKNPACLIYPAENHCRPGDHFRETERVAAEAFLSWEAFPFARPSRQHIADAITLASLLAVLVLLSAALLASARQSRTRP